MALADEEQVPVRLKRESRATGKGQACRREDALKAGKGVGRAAPADVWVLRRAKGGRGAGSGAAG